jgi:hypothetical protein
MQINKKYIGQIPKKIEKDVRGVDYKKSIQNILEKRASSTTCKFLKKCSNTTKMLYAHLECVHNNCARFGECQPKGVRGADYTM